MDIELRAKLEANRRITESGCWEWLLAKDPEGYGTIYYKGYTRSVHRTAFKEYSGSLDGLYVLHRCDNTSCFNPEHLFLGTQEDNNHDMARKNRAPGRTGYQVTHCKRGHEYTKENTYLRSGGRRECLACKNLKGRIRQHKIWGTQLR